MQSSLWCHKYFLVSHISSHRIWSCTHPKISQITLISTNYNNKKKMHYSKIIIREKLLGIVRWLGTSISPIYPSFDGLAACTGNSLRPRPLGGTKNKDIKHLHQNFCIDQSWSVGPTVPFLSSLGSPFNPKKTKKTKTKKQKAFTFFRPREGFEGTFQVSLSSQFDTNIPL